MKIAIWGYGKYGRRMFESLTRFCPDEYEVVRVYDSAYQKLKQTDGEHPLPILNPEDLTADYKNGVFEKVLLCIFDYFASRELKKLLREHSIPELHLGKPDDFYSMSVFDQGEKPFAIQQEGYEFCVLKNLCGAMANYESDELLYLFDFKGRVLKEHWSHLLYINAPCVYDPPFDLKKNSTEVINLKGQYCILTKKHAGNYWHFTFQCLDVVWLLEKAGYQGYYVIPNKSFCNELLRLLDVAPERIICHSKFEHNKTYVFEEVFYVALNGPYEIYTTPVLYEMAEYIKKKLTVDPSLPKKIYVKRIGRRKLLNADDLIAEYGFTTMVPEEYSVKEQMMLFYNADIVFSVHGANSTNCLYMRKGTIFIEAFSSYWINGCNLNSLAAAGINYLPVNALETAFENKDGIVRDFEIPEILLHMTIQNAFHIYQAQHESLLLK